MKKVAIVGRNGVGKTTIIKNYYGDFKSLFLVIINLIPVLILIIFFSGRGN
ncbi:MAG: hypothetical protein L6U99_00050 [Clostridium sp.]|nr:MAG: hypothetical protein L6U99_00050 [Clostridium sp.]